MPELSYAAAVRLKPPTTRSASIPLHLPVTEVRRCVGASALNGPTRPLNPKDNVESRDATLPPGLSRNPRVALHRDAGGGFHFLKLESVELVRQALALSPCHLKAGTAILQRWIPGFNPSEPSGLGVPCWINLKNLPLEFHQHEAKTLAAAVGTMLEEDKSGVNQQDPRFCVAINPNVGFAAKISVATVTGQFTEVEVEYEIPDTLCHQCPGAPHEASNCPSRGILSSPEVPPRYSFSRRHRGSNYNQWMSHDRGKHSKSRYGARSPSPLQRNTPDEDGYTLVERRPQQIRLKSPNPRSRRQYNHRSKKSPDPASPTDMEVDLPSTPTHGLCNNNVSGLALTNPASSRSTICPLQLPQAPQIPATTDQVNPSSREIVGVSPLPFAPPLTPLDNPLHISDITDDPVRDEDVDMVLEAEIEQYMIHLAEEQDLKEASQPGSSMGSRQDINISASGEARKSGIDNSYVSNPVLVTERRSNSGATQSQLEDLPCQVIQVEPASLTLELLGISINKSGAKEFPIDENVTNQGSRFAFTEETEEDQIQDPDQSHDSDSGPSPFEDEAFEDARSLNFSPVKTGATSSTTSPQATLVPRAISFSQPSHSRNTLDQGSVIMNHRLPLQTSQAEERDNVRAYRAIQAMTADRVRPSQISQKSDLSPTVLDLSPTPTAAGSTQSIRSARAAARALSSSPSTPPVCTIPDGLDSWGFRSTFQHSSVEKTAPRVSQSNTSQ